MSGRRECATCGAEIEALSDCVICGSTPKIGRDIGGKYRIEAPIGSGGMGRVYRATHLALGVRVAIKFLHLQLAREATVRERFRREARALAGLRHPGIVGLLDYGEEDGELYAVMELLEGEPLVAPPEGMAPPIAGPIFEQVLGALEACHDAGIVHRDVKPSNVMLTPAPGGPRVKLIDFGLVRTIGNPDGKLTETGLIQGTPRYMAPEQCRGEEVGPPADVYAVGVSMYEVLTGKPPFVVGDPASLMAHHLFVAPSPMSAHKPEIPGGLDALVTWALAKDPARRPTAGELRRELAAVFAGTDARAVSEAGWRERRRAEGLPRSARAVAEATLPLGRPSASVAGTVLLWLPHDARASGLIASLGARGRSASNVAAGGPAPPIAPGTVIILSARHDGRGRLEQLRAAHPGIGIIVIDVPGIEEASALVRAGVSDFSLEGAPDAELGGKIERLLRRLGRGQASGTP